MSFINPFARQLERFIYERVCALSDYAPTDRGGAGVRDTLASPCDGSKPRIHTTRR